MTPQNPDAVTVATNLRRLMAKDGLTFEEVVAATQLDERTLRAVARGRSNPHARTLHKLAEGLGVSIDELFHTPGRISSQRFDRATNSRVRDVIAHHSHLFAGWTEADFDELYSRFGTGGELTEAGVIATAEAMNAKREILRQASVVLESNQTELLAEFIAMLYRRTVSTPSPPAVRGDERG